MSFIFLAIIVLSAFAWVAKNSRLMDVLITGLLLGLSFLTPFWPVVIIGMYLKYKIEDYNKKKTGRDFK